MNAPAPADARVARLEAAYAAIAATRMLGMPVVNVALRVQAVGFAARVRVAGGGAASQPDADAGLLGILITPWSMNLVWLPDAAACIAAPGATRMHRLGDADYAFIGGADATAGAHEACSLFSPMFDFDGQAAAVAVAEEVLRQLAPAAAEAAAEVPGAPAGTGPAARGATEPRPARRAFLRGEFR
ncbi:[NiFe]-hydrogenase assembly chaperone HybE [Derxia lacustris]|uniref:[NiFe]-hydrogenase assembly chaperone HybE n=1 Tax=Derxia lacustris TaxID=764842 RepID=UPI000A172446|nr:[NiFe]-hydrogenase assembly chaperone HybE [Derxia lacustris]